MKRDDRAMRHGWKVALAAAGVALVGAAAFSSVPRSESATPATSLGRVTWADAAISSRAGSVLTVDALVEHLDERSGCGFTVKPHVTETATRVTIGAQVFTRPLPADTYCAGSALHALTTTVRLQRPLGDRALVDEADSAPHCALVVDRTPTLSAIRAPYRRKTTSWDESSGNVGEWWRWQSHGQSSQIDLEFGPTASPSRYDSPPPEAHHAEVGRAPALVWSQRTGDLLTTTVSWTDQAGRAVRLTLLDESAHPPSEPALIHIAESLR